MFEEITEGFIFGDFNSMDSGYILLERNCPTPNEKEIVENIPYMNGVFDFSELTGERYYENRQITYKLVKPNVAYNDRKRLENTAKYQLMRAFDGQLIDTHDNGYCWVGKCKSVKATDDQGKRNLILEITFDVYPFALKSSAWSDLWDEFDFDRDIAQKLSYQINGSEQIKLYNSGDNRISPKVIADKPITIIDSECDMFSFSPTKDSDFMFYLKRGKNVLTINGANANVSFKITTEAML